MARADLHVHSKYSDRPSEWFLKRIGTAESYTEPEDIYRIAIAQGMDFVTITDHNTITGSLMLKENHPDTVFTGIQVTSMFPEDDCKVHILVWNLDDREFHLIDKIRPDIYDLRAYLMESGLPHAVAHETYSINSRLTSMHMEKLILLFDYFEGLNGGRNRRINEEWSSFLTSLTSDDIQRMFEKFRISPASETPWKKGIIGGSDDHAGLFIGRSFTEVRSETIDGFFKGIKERRSSAKGRHSDFRGIAFSLYKIAIDFARNKSSEFKNSPLSRLTEVVLENRKLSFTQRIALIHLKSRYASRLKNMLGELLEASQTPEYSGSIDTRLEIVYDKLSDISDEFFRELIESIQTDVIEGNFLEIMKNVSASLPALFLSVPFVTTFRYLFSRRKALVQMKTEYGKIDYTAPKKILWFTDTFADLNGVSVTLKSIAWLAHKRHLPLRIVTSLLDHEDTDEIAPSVLRLPCITSFPLPYYEHQVLKVPSILRAMKLIYDEDPDEIIISTPGPIGLLGLALSKLMGVPSVGIYHTDYLLEASAIAGGSSILEALEGYTRWFFTTVDELRSPTERYIDILRDRAYGFNRVNVFRRGVDTERFTPSSRLNGILNAEWALADGITLLFAGRISRDKNLDFLFKVYEQLSAQRSDINLVIVGDGPERTELIERNSDNPRILFTGKLANELLPDLYANSDLFIFPSTTDTFGMAVLEALSCGTPCIVSDVGGPQELVEDGKSGFVLPVSDEKLWSDKILELITDIDSGSDRYLAMRNAARERVLGNHRWEEILDDIVRRKGPESTPLQVRAGRPFTSKRS